MKKSFLKIISFKGSYPGLQFQVDFLLGLKKCSEYSRDDERSSLVEFNSLLISDILVLRAKCPRPAHH